MELAESLAVINQKEVLNAEETALFLGLSSKQCVLREHRKGNIPGYKLGNKYFCLKSELLKHLKHLSNEDYRQPKAKQDGAIDLYNFKNLRRKTK